MDLIVWNPSRCAKLSGSLAEGGNIYHLLLLAFVSIAMISHESEK
jgi:hypothetical protein